MSDLSTVLAALEARLDAPAAEPALVVGTGKLLTAAALPERPEVVFKRLPSFPTDKARLHYQRAVDAYGRLLQEQIGVPVPTQANLPLTAGGRPLLYVAQARQPARQLAPHLLAHATDEEATTLLVTLTELILRVWHRNEVDSPHSRTGLDPRLANWSVRLQQGLPAEVFYLDTGLPLLRRIGRNLVDFDLFLAALPRPAPALLRRRFHRALDGYFDLRYVLVDFVADLYRERLADRLPLALEVVNGYLRAGAAAEFELEPLTAGEVERHYRADRRFWAAYRGFVRLGRLLRTAPPGGPGALP